MTDLERLINMVHGRPVDRGVFAGEGPWTETRERWLREGMPEDHNFGFDFPHHEGLGINTGFCPAFEPEVIEDQGDCELVRDADGIVKRILKGRSGMPQFVSFPVSDRKSWEQVRERLAPDAPGRYPADWEARVERLKQTEHMITFSGIYYGAGFSLLRQLCGDDVYYLFYDDPGLVHEIMDFQVYRMNTMMQDIASCGVRIDEFFLWEDMGFKTAPLVGPEMFREFFFEPYAAMIAQARACGAQIINVDSDGNTESLIPLWLEAGVNMHHPFEVMAGMDVVRTKREYGDRLVVRGGIDKRELAKDFAAIDREMQRVQGAYDMGGYIPTVDHAVPPDVSWDNYCYFIDKKAEMVDHDSRSVPVRAARRTQ